MGSRSILLADQLRDSVSIPALGLDVDPQEVAEKMKELILELYPICRSITGDGVRGSLSIIGQVLPLEVREVPTGTRVFDWVVPKEWNIRDAYVKGQDGQKVVDFQRSNLHVLNYSVPVRKRVSLDELKKHLFTLADHPTWIPYRTSYYDENWGFCISHDQFTKLPDGEYEVVIESSLADGSLTYGEAHLTGEEEREVLISTHVCHPSLCNDNLSGIAVAAFLGDLLGRLSLRYSYRFLFIPGTIGSITWLSLNESQVGRIQHGLVLACLGDRGGMTYKKSRRGTAVIDRAATHVLAQTAARYEIVEFSPYGYDERQFCSPGFNLPVGCLMRTPHGCYSEYHTSADDLDFVDPASLVDSLLTCLRIVAVLEGERVYVNQNSKCEPQLGKRGLYGKIGGTGGERTNQMALLWVLNLSDGQHSLLDIAERSGLNFFSIRWAATLLAEHGLLAERPT